MAEIEIIPGTTRIGWVPAGWWICPNDPPCIHGAALHDIEELGDPLPRCCSEGCPCGAQAKREGTGE